MSSNDFKQYEQTLNMGIDNPKSLIFNGVDNTAFSANTTSKIDNPIGSVRAGLSNNIPYGVNSAVQGGGPTYICQTED